MTDHRLEAGISGTEGDPGPTLVKDRLSGQIAGFLDFLSVERGLSQNTLAAYRRDLERYGGYLRARGIPDATAAEQATVADYLRWLSGSEYADGRRYRASSVARSLSAVRMFHLFLVREGQAQVT